METRVEEIAEERDEEILLKKTFKSDYCKYLPREFCFEAELSLHQKENIGRIHPPPLCQSNSYLTPAIRNNYFMQHDLNIHKRTIHENPTTLL